MTVVTRHTPLAHRQAMALAATEYARLIGLLESLSPADWTMPTNCPPWTVRDITGHLLGSMRMSCSLREQARQVTAAKRRGGPIADALSALQVERTAHLTHDEVLAEIRARAEGAVRGRRRVPAVARRAVRITAELPVAGTSERWPLGYLVDIIATRDGWMHRIDICEAVGAAPVLTADHDGVLVADVAGEWIDRHGQPVHLSLTGAAGGEFDSGQGGPSLTYDAITFCQLLSGRHGSPVLDTEVPF